MSNKKQTAVEWLLTEQISLTVKYLNKQFDSTDFAELRQKMENQAKQIEREQQEHAFKESRLTHPMVGFKHDTFEEYHSKTYGKP
jgi:predicted  nucleic acid-binding Zn-ribbon protein